MISASQIESLNICERMYGGRYLCGFKYIKNEAASLGNETHTIAENYHKHGKRPDRTTLAGRLFLLGIKYAPHPGVGHSEGEFVLKIGGISYKGLIDHIDGAHVTDYKTTGDLNADHILRVKEQFLANPQALIYAVKALVVTKAPEVRLTWIYMEAKWKGKAEKKEKVATRAEPFSVVLSKAEVEEAFARVVHPPAEKLVQLRKSRVDKKAPEKEKLAKFFSLTPNLNSCYKFGRCQFYDLCHNEEPTGEEMNTNDLAEKLRAQLAGAKGVNPPELKAAVDTAKQAPAATDNGQRQMTMEEYRAAVATQPAPHSAAQFDADAELGRAVRVILRALRG